MARTVTKIAERLIEKSRDAAGFWLKLEGSFSEVNDPSEMTDRRRLARKTPGRSRDPVRAQRADARRSQILDAAVQVFAHKGFHAATVRDIAKKAKLADGTMYLYFKNKNDLLLAILDRMRERERHAVESPRGLTPDANARTLWVDSLRQRIDVFRGSLRELQAVLPDILRAPVLRRRYLQAVLPSRPGFAEPTVGAVGDESALRELDPRLSQRIMPSLFMGLLVLRMLGDVEVDALWDALPEQLAVLLHPPRKAAPRPAAAAARSPQTRGRRRAAS